MKWHKKIFVIKHEKDETDTIGAANIPMSSEYIKSLLDQELYKAKKYLEINYINIKLKQTTIQYLVGIKMLIDKEIIKRWCKRIENK